MAATHDKERQLTREIAPKVESALPGTEVLAVELTSPERFTVFVDHVQVLQAAAPLVHVDEDAAVLPQVPRRDGVRRAVGGDGADDGRVRLGQQLLKLGRKR